MLHVQWPFWIAQNGKNTDFAREYFPFNQSIDDRSTIPFMIATGTDPLAISGWSNSPRFQRRQVAKDIDVDGTPVLPNQAAGDFLGIPRWSGLKYHLGVSSSENGGTQELDGLWWRIPSFEMDDD